MQEIQVTRAIILTPLSLVSTKSHHSVTNIGGDMHILTITVGYTDIYYNVGLYVASTWDLTILTSTCGCTLTGVEIHYVNMGRDSYSIDVGPCELIVGTNMGHIIF